MLLKKAIANAISIFKCNNHNREMSDKRKLIRKKKLQALVEKAGTIAEFCRANFSSDADKPINPGYVSQLLNGTRNFGEEAARNMENQAGFPEYYLDYEEYTLNTKTYFTDNDVKQILISVVLSLPDADLDMEMIALIKEALQTKKQNITKTRHVLSALNQDDQTSSPRNDQKFSNGE